MNRLEFAARCLARRDGVWDPDQPVVSKNFQVQETSKVRMMPGPEMVKPAWTFYLEMAAIAVQAAVNFDALDGSMTDAQLKTIAAGNTSLAWDHETNGFGVSLEHPDVVRFHAEARELFS